MSKTGIACAPAAARSSTSLQATASSGNKTLAVTGLSVTERRLDELGSIPIFTKPTNFDELLHAMRRVMIRPAVSPDV